MRDNKIKLSKTFFSIYSIQFFMSLLMIVLYLIYVYCFNNNYKTRALIQIIHLLSCTFDINWFFFGLEKFKITITRNIIIKFFSLFLIFLFVKTKNDLWVYTIIMATSTLASQLVLIPFLLKEIKYYKIKKMDIINHLKPCLLLFVPVIAISLYKIMDKIMLGIMSSVNEVGLYEQAEKIVNIPFGIITALGTVMLPRISNLVSKGDDNKIKKYIEKSITFMMFLAFPMTMGIMAISDDFIPLFLGKEFLKSSTLVYYLSTTIIFLSLANVIRTQYLLPKEKDKIYILSVILGALINLIINYILIPKYSSIGAAIGTIIAEFIVMVVQILCINRELPIKEYIVNIIPFFIKSTIMFFIIFTFRMIKMNSLLRIIIQVIIGCIIYFLLNMKYILSILNVKYIKIRGRKIER